MSWTWDWALLADSLGRSCGAPLLGWARRASLLCTMPCCRFRLAATGAERWLYTLQMGAVPAR